MALGKLSKDFQLVLRRFQQLAEDSAQHARDTDAAEPPSHPAPQPPTQPQQLCGWRSAAALDDDDDDDDDDDGLGGRGGEQRGLLAASRERQVQVQQQQQQRGHTTAEAMAEREKIITQVETTVVEVKEIFSDLANLVSEQTEQISHISSAIENTAAQAGRATDELKVASRYKAQLRSRKCCLYLSLIHI